MQANKSVFIMFVILFVFCIQILTTILYKSIVMVLRLLLNNVYCQLQIINKLNKMLTTINPIMVRNTSLPNFINTYFFIFENELNMNLNC